MSGTKYSEIKLMKEQKEKQDALSKLDNLNSVLNSLKEKCRNIMDSFSSGVKDSFRSEFESAKNWLISNIPTYSSNMSSSELKKILQIYERFLNEGEKSLKVLTEIKNVRFPQKLKDLFFHYEKMKTELEGYSIIAKKWDIITYNSLIDEVENLNKLIQNNEIKAAEDKILSIKERFKKFFESISDLEEKDKQRKYVLESLRIVIKDMGWIEDKPPYYEKEDNAQSDIIYEVNALSAGTLLFRLSLEGIKVDSPITNRENRCYKEFKTLSEEIKKMGVITDFKVVNPNPDDPILKKKGELEFPDDDSYMEKEA